MHAARELRGFVGVAGFAIDFGNVIGVGIFLDVGVAVVTLQATVNAGAELVAVDGDAVACRILHGLVAMAGEAVRLRRQVMGRQEDRECEEADSDCPVMSNKPEKGG